MKILSKIFKRKSSNIKYWNFKKIPLDNWQQCQDGNIYFVRKGLDEDAENEVTEKDIEVWQSLQDNYIEEFQDDKTKALKLLSLKVRLANLKLQYIQDSKKNRVLANSINEIEEKLKIMRDSESHVSMTLDECRAMISKHQGYHLPDNIRAYSFFSILKTITKNG